VRDHEAWATLEAVASVDGNMAAAVETLAGISVGHGSTTTEAYWIFMKKRAIPVVVRP
jgi:hypothetical protein